MRSNSGNWLAGVAVLLVACGGSGGEMTATVAPPVPIVPVTPTSVVTTIIVSRSATDTMFSRGDTRALTAEARDQFNAHMNGVALTWTSSNGAVATVAGADAGATVTATGTGTATITAQSGTVSATVLVPVRQRAATLGLAPQADTLAIGQTRQLAVSVFDGRQNAMSGLAAPTYTSSDASKVTVSAGGLIMGVSPGTATISVQQTTADGKLTGAAAVTVSPSGFPSSASVTVQSNFFTPAAVDIAVGGTVTWTWASGGAFHNVTSTSGAFDTIVDRGDGSESRAFPMAGAFNYQCTLHAGMVGVVTVH